MKVSLALWAVLALAACGGGSDNGDDDNSGDDCVGSACEQPPSKCGNGDVDVATETCDDSNTQSGDGCSATCQSECGNGVVDGTTEQCDDANLANDDGCTSLCVLEPGYTCVGSPSLCSAPTGECAEPFLIAFTSNAGTDTATVTGDTTGGTDDTTEAECDGYASGSAPDETWTFTLTEARDVTITLSAATSFDTALRVLGTACDVESEIIERPGEDGCSDAYGTGETLHYTSLAAGTYHIVVDGYYEDEFGTYSFTINTTAPQCGNGTLQTGEECDDGDTDAGDGCSAICYEEPGYSCTGTPSVCGSTCGDGVFDTGEECDDGNLVGTDRCSETCTLTSDITEVEPNDTTAQQISAANHRIRGALGTNDDDLYTFTLTAPATVEIELYNVINLVSPYDGVGTQTELDCSFDSELFLFDAAGVLADNETALYQDDEEGDGSCSYIGPHDGPSTFDDDEIVDPTQGVLPAGTYTIKVTYYNHTGTTPRYIVDLKVTPTTPGGGGAVAPVAGDLVLNEFMAGDSSADTNCDTATTGTNDEFVELVNVSSHAIDLTGVTIADSVVTRHTFAAAGTGSMTLDAGKAVVVWGGGAPACAGVTNWFTASSNQLGLNDAGDTITVQTAGGASLLTHAYGTATLTVSFNLSPDVTGVAYALHTAVNAASFSPGKRANGTAF